MHEREADKVMAESYKQRQGVVVTRAEGHKQGVIREAARVTGRGGSQEQGSQEQKVTSKGS